MDTAYMYIDSYQKRIKVQTLCNAKNVSLFQRECINANIVTGYET